MASPLTAIVAQPGITNVQSTADQYRYNGEMPPDQALEEQALNRRQQIANLLIQQGLGQAGANHGQMVGRFYVPGSPVQNLAGLASIAAGAYGTYKGDQSREALREQTKQATADAVRDYIEKTRGTPERTLPEGTEGPVNPAIPPDAAMARAKIAETMASRIPGLANMAQVDFAQMNKPAIPVNTGNATTMLDATTYQPKAVIPHGVSPDTAATLAAKQAERGTISAEKAAELAQQEKTHTTPSGTAVLEDTTKRALYPIPSGSAIMAANAQTAMALQAHNDRMIIADQNNRNDMANLEIRKSQGMDRKEYDKEKLALENKWHGTQAQLEKEKIDIQKQAHNEGKIPLGYEKVEGGLKAIPGGPADLKQEGKRTQALAGLQSMTSDLDRLAVSANQILNHPGLAGITGLRGALMDIPGTQAADARALLNKLKSQVGFSVLQNMRNNSKSGGALGNVSDNEGKRLENNLASVESAQSIDQMKTELKGIIDYVNGSKERLTQAYDQTYGEGKGASTTPAASAPSTGPAKITNDAEYNALPSGTIFIAPDGKQRKKP